MVESLLGFLQIQATICYETEMTVSCWGISSFLLGEFSLTFNVPLNFGKSSILLLDLKLL